MIEIATCMIDLADGAVWRHKVKQNRLVRIRKTWITQGGSGACVGFDIWDYELKCAAWETGGVMDAVVFEMEYVYADQHVLNNAREYEKTKYLTQRVLSDLSDCMDVEMRMQGRELLKTLMTLARRSAGYDVVLHEWDEGCAGSGCCADTAEMAGDKLLDDNVLTAEQVASILSDDREAVPAVTSDIDAELCPNGQSREECTEIDPCETCWQDQNDEGNAIEESMGLR